MSNGMSPCCSSQVGGSHFDREQLQGILLEVANAYQDSHPTRTGRARAREQNRVVLTAATRAFVRWLPLRKRGDPVLPYHQEPYELSLEIQKVQNGFSDRAHNLMCTACSVMLTHNQLGS